MNSNDVLLWVIGVAGILVAAMMFHVGKIKGFSEAFSHFASEHSYYKLHDFFKKGTYWKVVEVIPTKSDVYYSVKRMHPSDMFPVLIRKSDVEYDLTEGLVEGRTYELYPDYKRESIFGGLFQTKVGEPKLFVTALS